VAALSGKIAAVGQLEALMDEGFDLFFNFCDGAADQDIPGIEIIEAMERRGVPFVGASSACYEPTRAKMKDACARVGVATPKFVFVQTE
jgi:D-alanine-D-alanine ligase